MSFRQYGGINYAARNNIVKNNYTNANNLSVMTKIGQLDSVINVESGLNMSSNITFKYTGSPEYGITFSDGTTQSTAVVTTDSYWQEHKSSIYYTNRVVVGGKPYDTYDSISSTNVKLAVKGDIAFYGNIYTGYLTGTTGTSTFIVEGISGNTGINGTLDVSGNTHFYSGLTVDGALTTLSSGLTVTGGSGLTVYGDSYFKPLNPTDKNSAFKIQLTNSNCLIYTKINSNVNDTIIQNNGGGALQLIAGQNDGFGNGVYINGANGNVGINNIDPKYNLDVSGILGVSGSTTLNSDLTVIGDINMYNGKVMQAKNYDGENETFLYPRFGPDNIMYLNYGLGGFNIRNSLGDSNTAIFIEHNFKTTFYGKLIVSNNDALINGLTVGKGGGGDDTNTAVGNNSLFSNSQGQWNVAIGNGASYYQKTGSSNVAVGYQAFSGGSNASGSNNIAIGNNAISGNTTGSNNIGIGYYSLVLNQSASNNVGIGYASLKNNVIGENNIAIGYKSLYTNDASYNTAIGYESLFSNKNGINNTAIGYQSLFFNNAYLIDDKNIGNTAVGYKSLYSNTNGVNNTAVGYQSLFTNDASYNTAFGESALYSNTIGDSNTGIGLKALYYNTSGTNNVAVGRRALFCATENGGSLGSGSYNVSLGNFSLYLNNTGNNNTAVGDKSGYNNIDGSNNTFIGYHADCSGNALTYSTAIGANAIITKNDQIMLGGQNNLGIYPAVKIPGTLDVTGATTIDGTISAYNTSTTDYQGAFYNGYISEGVLLSANGTTTEIKMNNSVTTNFSIQNTENTFRIVNTSSTPNPYETGTIIMTINTADNNNTTFSGGLTVSGVATLNNKLTVSNGGLAVTGNSYFEPLNPTNKDSAFKIELENSNCLIYTRINPNSNDTIIQNNGGGALQLIAGQNDGFGNGVYINGSNGYVGINNINPAYNLDVSGTLCVTGNTTFTGIPSAPTAAAGTNNTQIATTAFVKNAVPKTTVYQTNQNITFPTTVYKIDYIVISGGGGGAPYYTNNGYYGGGGGGGAFVTGTFNTPNNYSGVTIALTIGSGGTGGLGANYGGPTNGSPGGTSSLVITQTTGSTSNTYINIIVTGGAGGVTSGTARASGGTVTNSGYSSSSGNGTVGLAPGTNINNTGICPISIIYGKGANGTINSYTSSNGTGGAIIITTYS